MTTWKSRVKDLIATGLTQAEIGELCDVGTATVSDVARGKTEDPRWSFASKLDKLHRERCQKKSVAA